MRWTSSPEMYLISNCDDFRSHPPQKVHHNAIPQLRLLKSSRPRGLRRPITLKSISTTKQIDLASNASNRWPRESMHSPTKRVKTSLCSPIYSGNIGNVQGLCQFVDICLLQDKYMTQQNFTPRSSDDSWTPICIRTTFLWKASWWGQHLHNLTAVSVWAVF